MMEDKTPEELSSGLEWAKDQLDYISEVLDDLEKIGDRETQQLVNSASHSRDELWQALDRLSGQYPFNIEGVQTSGGQGSD